MLHTHSSSSNVIFGSGFLPRPPAATTSVRAFFGVETMNFVSQHLSLSLLSQVPNWAGGLIYIHLSRPSAVSKQLHTEAFSRAR